MSNFDWTDKTSSRWFLMLTTGHEGPYSLEDLQQKVDNGKISPDINVWTIGLSEVMTLRSAMERSNGTEEDLAPPPIPFDDDLPPELPTIPHEKKNNRFRFLVASIAALLVVCGVLKWIDSKKKFYFKQPPEMTKTLYTKIKGDHQFAGFNKNLFFKEYTPKDMSRIWLVTSSFHRCDVEATFRSIKDKLITKSPTDTEVAFRTKGKLKQHVVEFDRFQFFAGKRILRGLYEMDLKARNCEWTGWVPNLANFFSAPQSEYLARMKVILYPEGPEEFNSALTALIKLRANNDIIRQSAEANFWMTVEQKYQTLLAITLQIEQHFLDLMAKDARLFETNLPNSVEIYTKKFGHFLTQFVTANEKDFKLLKGSTLPVELLDHEKRIRNTSKNVGKVAMYFIEDLQKRVKEKKIKRADLVAYEARLKKDFARLRESIEEKLELATSKIVR